ncbi:MAG: hypothetical protein AAF741_16190 [Bacteroidota bacterium]
MKNLQIFLLEWKHFIRSPFKIIALALFIIAGMYGLHQGANLYQKQIAEIETIRNAAQEQRQEIIDDHYRTGVIVPEDTPWVDYSSPFWGAYMSNAYHFKAPSPAMIYSIGQAEQYGFYKKITFFASPYDADMAEEIANPERLQIGTLDFSFVLLFLSPLVLLVLLYNLKSMETEKGIIPLIEVQMPAKNTWLFLRMLFYVSLLLIAILILLTYGAGLAPVFDSADHSFAQTAIYAALYVAFWSAIYFLILRNGKSILGNTLQMSAAYLLFAFIIPAAVHQSLSIRQPANLMTGFIDVRDQLNDLRDGPDSLYAARLIDLYPEVVNTPVYQDSFKLALAMNYSGSMIMNDFNKASIQPIEAENEAKNDFIESTFWFNPVSFFQNRLNAIAQTHYDDYQAYRSAIQSSIDQQIQMMVKDLWNEVQVDEEKYLEYATGIGK